MFAVNWSEAAIADLDSILRYLGEVNPRFRCCSSVWPYLIIYRIDAPAEAVIITRLVHGHQSLEFMRWLQIQPDRPLAGFFVPRLSFLH